MTFEDVKRIRQNPTAEEVDYQELHKMIDLAVEKQIPKKPRVDDDSWYCCPRCDETFFMWDKLRRRLLYCGNCGQKLDWSKADAQKRSDTNDR